MDKLPVSDVRNRLLAIEPQDFEHFIADIWAQRGWHTRVTTLTNDKGVDIIATKDDVIHQKHLIQAKRYAEGNKIGGPELQQYAGLRSQHPDADAVIITTTSTFTQNAEEIASDANVKCIDGDDLVSLVRREGYYEILNKYAAYEKIPEAIREPPESEEEEETRGVTSAETVPSPRRDTLSSLLDSTRRDAERDLQGPEEPIVFREIHRNVPTGPIDGKTYDPKAVSNRFFEVRIHDSVDQGVLRREPTDSVDWVIPDHAVIRYLWPDEPPAFILKDDSRGFADSEGNRVSPSETCHTIHIITDRRLISLVGKNTDGDAPESISIPLAEIQDVTTYAETDRRGPSLVLGAKDGEYRFYADDLRDETLRRRVEAFVRNGPHDRPDPSLQERMETVSTELRTDTHSPYVDKLESLLEEHLRDRQRSIPEIRFEFEHEHRTGRHYTYTEGLHRTRGLDEEQMNVASQIAEELHLRTVESSSDELTFGRQYVGPQNVKTEVRLIVYLLEAIYDTTLSNVLSVRESGGKYAGWE